LRKPIIPARPAQRARCARGRAAHGRPRPPGHRPRRRHGTVELQDALHHELHLRLLGAAGSDHRLLDLARRVLEHLGIRSAVPQIAAPRAWPSFKRAVGIAIDEHALDGDLLRPVLRDDGLHAAEDLAQARREFTLWVRMTPLAT
jgi:hypothetical protein